MNISHLNIGILHSLIGKNDGVSIVIDQSVMAMMKDMDVPLGNIFFLAAHTSPRFNAMTNDVFWHKNDIHRLIISRYSEDEVLEGLDEMIHARAMEAKNIIAGFIEKNEIDLLIAHNTSHPYNFITAVGLGYYLEDLRRQNIIWPKILVWWHDSYFERDKFKKANAVIAKYLKYLPGTMIDGIAFINHEQPAHAKAFFEKYCPDKLDSFILDRTTVVPNTSEIVWDWKSVDWDHEEAVFPPQDSYNFSFLKDIGLIDAITQLDFSLNDTVILLQHTRVVPRKKIEVALDYAFALEQKFQQEGFRKCVVLLVSGHSGDEQEEYKNFLNQYYHEKQEQTQGKVILLFGEDVILSHRDIIVDKKYYKFSEVPSIIASYGGMGTYFSEVEGYGNNLLEMLAAGLPVAINRYAIYRSDIEHLGFELPFIDHCILNREVVDRSFRLLNNTRLRNKFVKHNLSVLHDKLGHQLIAQKLRPVITNIFTRKI